MTTNVIPQSSLDGKSLNEHRRSNTKCDVIIQVGHRSFFAHRKVLLARSSYFREHFDKTPKERLVVLDDDIVDGDHFEEVLQYVYVNEIRFTKDNLEPVWKAANLLGVKELLQEAREYLKKNITVGYGMKMIGLDEIFSDSVTDKLSAECERLLQLNPFSRLAQKLFVPLLKLESLNRLLARLNGLSKQEVMVAYCLEWVNSDSVALSDRLADLLRTIPLSCLSFADLKKLSADVLVKENDDCMRLMAETMMAAPQSDRLYVLGGYDNDGVALSSVSYFDWSYGYWVSAAPMPVAQIFFGCVAIGTRIYVCGGKSGGTNQSTDLFVMETATNKWKKLASMTQPRETAGMATIGEYIYVAGGFCGGTVLNTVVRYSIRRNRWDNMAPMLYARTGLQLLTHGQFLYAVGGTQSAVCGMLERYDPSRNEWSLVGTMARNISLFGSTIFQGCIFVANETTFQAYDLSRNRGWANLKGWNWCGEGRELVSFHGELIAIGGNVPKSADRQGAYYRGISTIKKYDFVDAQWINYGDMDYGRCCHKAVVVKRG